MIEAVVATEEDGLDKLVQLLGTGHILFYLYG